MAKAKKLPSGSWRCQVYDYTNANGKRVYRSFTACTKKEAEYLAAEYVRNKGNIREEMTVKDIVTRYIDMKRDVLSPSTIRGYTTCLRNHYKEIEHVNIKKLNNTIIQMWISNLSQKLSPKSISNAHGLLMAALDVFIPGVTFKTTMPQKTKPDLYIPNDDDVKVLLQKISGTELEIAVLLAAFGPMRRGEICALESGDVTGNIVNVNKSMVRIPNGGWMIKQPKTFSSYRKIEFPDFVIGKISDKNGRIIKATPDQITNRFVRALNSCGLPHFRFHDLRHYAASVMHAIGIPDVYIMQRGGWKTDAVMKSVYRHTLSDKEKLMNQQANNYFDNLCNTKCNTH